MGQAATTTFSIPKNSLDHWIKRLDHFDISHKEPKERFDEGLIYFEDYDGLGLELIANDRDDRAPLSYGQIPLEHAIRGFYSVELWENTYERTEALLINNMDHRFVAEAGPRRRYSTTEAGTPGQIIDALWDAQKRAGAGGSGTVHHIAFDTPSDGEQLEMRERPLRGEREKIASPIMTLVQPIWPWSCRHHPWTFMSGKWEAMTKPERSLNWQSTTIPWR